VKGMELMTRLKETSEEVNRILTRNRIEMPNMEKQTPKNTRSTQIMTVTLLRNGEY